MYKYIHIFFSNKKITLKGNIKDFLNFREFSNERTRVERRETFRKLRMRENFSKAFEGYFQWISKAGTQLQKPSCWVSQMKNLFLDFYPFVTPSYYLDTPPILLASP